ncbi:MAG: imidazole glycerol phosphate synthase subunit HisH [Candidatus Diapherotrites archaeon]
MIGVIDLGIGNTGSVLNSLRNLGFDCGKIENREDFRAANKIIFPGVGSFGSALKKLEETGIMDELLREINSGKEFLGICLGMQLLFEDSEESPGSAGFSVLRGKVKKFKSGKVPQIGWNYVKSSEKILPEGYYYFANSFYCTPAESKDIVAMTEYRVEFASAVRRKNIFAVQFHPEKSGKLGIEFLRRWCEC